MNLLITGAWADGKSSIAKLEALGHRVTFLQFEKDPIPCDYDWVEGVIANGLFLHHPIEEFSNLRYIQLTSAGFDRVPMDYVEEKKIQIFNARGVYSIPMAEFALCGVLQLYKQSRFFHNAQREHRWEKHRGLIELYGKTVCIVGCGSVGSECARRFAALGCRVTGVDLYPREDSLYETMFALQDLDAALSAADVAVLTLPLTEQTRHLINADRLAAMKKGSMIVNIARGAVVDTDALLVALRNNIGGAVLDVFETEPLDTASPLWDMENVILTPHNSFVSDGNAARLHDIIVENLKVC